MGAVENSLVVLPVQSCASAGDEPRVLCIVHNTVSGCGRGPGSRTFINLPMSVSCQTLIDDIKSKFDHLPTEFSVVYERPTEGENTTSVKINDYPEKPIGEICLHCGDRGRNNFFVCDVNSASSEIENWDASVKPRSTRSNAICEAMELRNADEDQMAPTEADCKNKDNYDACSASASASASSGIYSFSLNALPKSDTGYVGLVNQAMTCYLNSLLQTLYMTPEFRNAVYRWKFDGLDADASHSIPYQLQRLFLQLQTSNKRAVETTDITRSFGWDSSEAWHQHDIQELCRVMFDALERTWKSTDQENLINELYQGRMKDYVKCLKCGSVNARPDTYLDLPLVIRPFGLEVGYGSVEQALKAFEEPEILDGSNQYFCEKCGQHCDAHKGLCIVSFPYILTLHLKRFGFDHCTYQRFKLNDRMTFPEVLTLERFAEESVGSCENAVCLDKSDGDGVEDQVNGVGNKAADDDDVNSHCRDDVVEDEGIDIGEGVYNVDNKMASGSEAKETQLQATQMTYQLFSIMVHSGSAAGGHYYAYIRPFKDGQWYSFNDQHVFKISDEDIERTFGGSSGSSTSYSTYSSSTNAYMLQYRLVDPGRNRNFMEEADFPEHLREELISIQRKEEEELHLQELDRNTCKIKLYVYNSSLEKYMDHKLEVHKSKTLAEATEMAWKQMELVDVPLECARLVKFDRSREYIEQSLEGEEDKAICCVLGGVKSSYHFDLLLEVRKPNEEFVSHFRGGIVVHLHLVDLLHEVIHLPKELRILPNKTVQRLKQLISETFGLGTDAMTLVSDKGYASFSPLLDPHRTLSEEGFEKVNRVFVECSGAERYDGYFQATKFFQILDRFANTISVTIALPSLNEITRMHPSLLRSYFMNQPTIQDSNSAGLLAKYATPVNEKLADVDEGIGESETDIHCRTCTGDAPSETDLNSYGVGTSEVMSRTSDWCSSICSNELSHDATDQHSCFSTNEAPLERKLSLSLAADGIQFEMTTSLPHSATDLPVENAISSTGVRLTEETGEAGTNFKHHTNNEGDSNNLEPPYDSKPVFDAAKLSYSIDGEHVLEIEEVNITVPDPQGADAVRVTCDTDLQSVLDSFDALTVLPSSISCTDKVPTCGTGSAVEFNEQEPMLLQNTLGEMNDVALDADILADVEESFPPGGDNDDFHSLIATPQTSPQVSSNGSNSPELENVKELSCPKESEENWDLEETQMVMRGESNFSYFTVVREINGLFERSLTVEVDQRMTLGRLKAHLEPYMGTSVDNFRVFRFSLMGPDLEMTKVYEQLHSLAVGSKLLIKLGRALKPGEYKLSVYQLLIHESEPIKFLVEVIVPKGISLADLKLIVIDDVRAQFGVEIPRERCRLRRKAWKNPAGIFTNDAMLEELFKDSTNIEIFLEVLDDGPDRMEIEETTLLQLYVRRWRPLLYQLDPVQELIVSDWTLVNIRKEISRLSGIDEDNVCVAKARGQFPCNIPVLDVEKEMQWNLAIVDISVFPMSVADDGAVLFYKDRTEPLAELTEEQRKDFQENENAKLQKAKPSMRIPNKAERTLKIYTVTDHHDSRPSSQPI